jgi:hypothetical protein
MKEENKKIEEDKRTIEKNKKGIEELEIQRDDLLVANIFKEEYEGLEYDLPNFEILAEDFDIEKAYEKESSFLLREIRRIIVEKLSAYLQLFETLMNPSSPPMFIFRFLRKISEKDRELIKRLYDDLSKYQLWSVKLDTIYSEENEAEYIKSAFSEWQKLKKEIYDLIERLEKEEENQPNNSKSGYFG